MISSRASYPLRRNCRNHPCQKQQEKRVHGIENATNQGENQELFTMHLTELKLVKEI